MQGCSVTAYRLDRAKGTLSSEQTISSLPAGHSERTTRSQIHLTPSGRFLYVGNRAASGSSIAAFAVDPADGHLTVAGHIPTEAVPGAFCLDPAGHFLFAAGTASGNQQSGALTPLTVEEVGRRPAAGGGAGDPSRLIMQPASSSAQRTRRWRTSPRAKGGTWLNAGDHCSSSVVVGSRGWPPWSPPDRRRRACSSHRADRLVSGGTTASLTRSQFGPVGGDFAWPFKSRSSAARGTSNRLPKRITGRSPRFAAS